MIVRKSGSFVRHLVGGCLLFATGTAFAGTWVNANMVGIRAFSTQTEQFVQVRDFANPENCTAPGILVLLRDDTSNWKMVHELLVRGLIHGKRVQVRTAGCHAGTGHTIIDGARLLKY